MDSTTLINRYQKFFVPNLVSCLLEVGVNALLLHAFRRMNKLKTVSFRLFATLSVSDILLASFSALMDTVLIVINAGRSQLNTIRLASIAVRFLFGEFSALMTVLIAVDRYIHLMHPFSYAALMTKSRSTLATVSLAFVSLTMIALIAIAYACDFYKEMLAITSAVNLLVIFASCCIYYRALKSIKHRVNHATFNVSNSRYDREFSRAVLFILGSQILLYTPFILIKPISEFTSMRGASLLHLTFMSQLFIYIQGIVNVLLFIHFHKETKMFIKQLLVCYNKENQRSR